MEHIEIILRTTASSGKVTEQLLVRFDTENLAIERDKVLEYSGLCIDPDKHQVSYQGSVLPLTETYEFQTLVYLASQPRRVFTKEQIYEKIWGYDNAPDASNLSSFIRKLRLKIEPHPDNPRYIITVWGVGYKFSREEKP